MAVPSASPGSARASLFTGANAASRCFEALVAASAVLLGTYMAGHVPARTTPLGTWPAIIITAVAGIAAIAPGGLFIIPTGQKTHRNPGSGAVFAFLLTLPLRQALPIAFGGMLITQLFRRYYRRERLTWPTIAFNLSQYVVTWALAGATFVRVQLNLASWPEAARWATAVVCAGAVYILVNTWIVAVWSALRRRALAWDLWIHIIRHLVSARWIPLAIGAVSARIAGHFPVLGLAVLGATWVAHWSASRVGETRLRELTSGLGALVEAAERRSPEFAEHSERVAWWAQRLALRLGVSEVDTSIIAIAAKLHDFGKAELGIPIVLDSQPDADLTAVRLHPVVASDILERFRGLETVARYVRSQTEWFNGSGYPDGRAGKAIPLASRIITVVDAYDTALRGHQSLDVGGIERALAVIRHDAGTQFDPAVVDALEATARADAASPAYTNLVLGRGQATMAVAFAGSPNAGLSGPWPFDANRIAENSAETISTAAILPWDPLTSRDRRRSGTLLDKQEAERRHLARELHDEIGATLTQLSFVLQTVPASGSAVDDAQAIVQTLIQRVRDMSLDLRPFMLDDFGLAAALGWYTDRFASRTGIRVHLTDRGLDRRFSLAVETTAYRIVQEALTNSAKHGRASEVTIVVEAGNGVLMLSVSDNGTGFDPEVVRNSGRANGIVGMRERAMSVGGALRIGSRLGGGTRIDVSMPTRVSNQWKRIH